MKARSLAERLWANVDRKGPDECWLWTGAVTEKGYGRIQTTPGKKTTVHRVAYELLVGPIPEGLVLDHFNHCNTRCCNPAHLEPKTSAENSRNCSPLSNERRAAANRARRKYPAGSKYVRSKPVAQPRITVNASDPSTIPAVCNLKQAKQWLRSMGE